MLSSRIRRTLGTQVVLAALALAGCSSGDVTPPDTEPAPITQPTEGDGWRLLGEEVNVGEAYRTGIATTDDQLRALLAESGLAIETPQIDWDRDVVVWFGMTWGTGCPVLLVGVVVTDDLLHGDFDYLSQEATPSCNEDINPHSFLVAVDREMLPAGPFTIYLTHYTTHNLARQEATVVDADLSAPGSALGDPHPQTPEGVTE